MIVYNLTMKAEQDIHDEWLQWQREEHIPEIMATGRFTDYKFFRLLEQDESDGITYVLQFFAEDMQQYKKYMDEHSSLLRQKAIAKWGNRFIVFRTVMKIVQ